MTSPSSRSTQNATANADPPANPVISLFLKDNSSNTEKFAAGFISGILVAGLFNPWDRALYLSVLHNRPFLHSENFKKPYHGFMQVMIHRTLSNGLYFPLYDLFKNTFLAHTEHLQLNERKKGLLISLVAGNTAGAISGTFLNGITAVKYVSWENQKGFFHNSYAMWRAGGMEPFTRGIYGTVVRDSIFGGVFASTKFLLPSLYFRYRPENSNNNNNSNNDDNKNNKSSNNVVHRHLSGSSNSTSANVVDFVSALIGGALGTILSSPINYARNIQYGAPSHTLPPTLMSILKQLMTQTMEQETTMKKMMFLQDRLRVGWGTLRVGVGMAVGSQVYDISKRLLSSSSSST